MGSGKWWHRRRCYRQEPKVLALVFFMAMNDCVKSDVLHIFWMILYAHYVVKLCHLTFDVYDLCLRSHVGSSQANPINEIPFLFYAFSLWDLFCFIVLVYGICLARARTSL
jgi:hypothetical protein